MSKKDPLRSGKLFEFRKISKLTNSHKVSPDEILAEQIIFNIRRGAFIDNYLLFCPSLRGYKEDSRVIGDLVKFFYESMCNKKRSF